jgi:uncharacterized repeat protein (TIGR01451 family)
LDYPFPNWSDAVVPAPGTAVPFRDQERVAVAVARQEFAGQGEHGSAGLADQEYAGQGEHVIRPVGTPVGLTDQEYAGDPMYSSAYTDTYTGARTRRTVFLAFPFEALPETGRAEVMERTIGWLSWLGGSTFTTDRRVVSSGDALTYSVVLRNDGPETVSTSFSNTLPLSLTMISGSLAGPATYQQNARLLSWRGGLSPGASVAFTYRATVSAGLPAGTLIINTAYLGLEDQGLRFRRSAAVRVGAPDLSPSVLQCGPSPARPGAVITCTVILANSGPGQSGAVVVTNLLPADTSVAPGSLVWTGGGMAETLTGTVRWSGPLSAGSRVTVTYRLALPVGLSTAWRAPLYSVALLEDGVGEYPHMGEVWERPAWVLLEPYGFYLPVVAGGYTR